MPNMAQLITQKISTFLMFQFLKRTCIIMAVVSVIKKPIIGSSTRSEKDDKEG